MDDLVVIKIIFNSLLNLQIFCLLSLLYSSLSLHMLICFFLAILSILYRNLLFLLGTSLWSFYELSRLFLMEMRVDCSFCELSLSRSSGRRYLDLCDLGLENRMHWIILLFEVSSISLRRYSCVEESPT